MVFTHTAKKGKIPERSDGIQDDVVRRVKLEH
jgi:hypothetical protein